MHEYTRALITLFIGYNFKHKEATKYAEFYFSTKIDYDKGFCLLGSPGLGKTSTFENMRTFTQFHDPEKRLRFKKYRHETLNSDCLENGMTAIDGFCKPFNVLIDNVTGQAIIKHYGQDIAPFELFFLKRYEQYKSEGRKTHITSDIPIDELQKVYSERVVSRIYEMCNVIVIEEGVDNRIPF